MVKQTCKNLIIALIAVLLFMLLIYSCKDTEPFANAISWAKGLGYPRPQGNLGNYKYGTKEKDANKEKKNWNNVMKKNRELFKVPTSRTILG